MGNGKSDARFGDIVPEGGYNQVAMEMIRSCIASHLQTESTEEKTEK